jgi:hypothetical protein
MKRKSAKYSLGFILVLLFVEVSLRIFGLGDLPVYIEDAAYEYIYAPNQDVKRFGNRIITNEFSMRSLPLSEKDQIRILKMGDSVINGGSQTDHVSLASSILEKHLSDEFQKNIRVLNVGANSWGPDNALAYIRKHGNLGASMLVLVFSSHDLYDHMHFQKVVGVNPSWPDKKPFCAISDAGGKYITPWFKQQFLNHNSYDYLNSSVQSDSVNPGWKGFFDYVRENNLSLLVYLHPATDELNRKEFDKRGKQIISMLEENQIQYLSGMEYESVDGFRDQIHLNDSGQKVLAQALFKPLRAHIAELRNKN